MFHLTLNTLYSSLMLRLQSSRVSVFCFSMVFFCTHAIKLGPFTCIHLFAPSVSELIGRYYFISRYSAIPLSGFQLLHFSTLIGANGSHGIRLRFLVCFQLDKFSNQVDNVFISSPLTFPRLFPAGRV